MSGPPPRLLLTLALLLLDRPLRAAPPTPQPPRSGPTPTSALTLTPRQLLEDPVDPLRRETAALVLGRARVRAAVPALLLRLRHDRSRWVRAACGEALGQIGDLRAVEGLRLALGREKNQQVRRRLAEALLRLGHKSGLLELMWQLRVGTQHSRSEAMRALVNATGQPLGQTLPDWWTYLARRGYRRVATRPHGAPAPLQISGDATELPLGDGKSHRQLCAATLHLGGGTIGPAELRKALATQAAGAEGCFLLLATHGTNGSERIAFSGLSAAGVDFLVARFPKLQGIGIDRRALAAPSQAGALRARLAAHKLRALRDLRQLHRLPGSVTNVLAISRGGARVLLLALQP